MWEGLSSGGGKTLQCGWLTDKFGLSWQVVPAVLPNLVLGADQAKVSNVMKAMMQMTKIDIAKLQHARDEV